ncbi:MAG: L-seryl-tRNA(Sec) selenium transferase [Gemmataceae bacterium]|jgi:L-seryl-tRNA(Ser) seleniumtransferase|nr:L-seryl-tRNA(Sec) selenium transferase [Gemmataceae bacterium]
MADNLFRRLPPTHEILACPELVELEQAFPHETIVQAVRAELDAIRHLIRSEKWQGEVPPAPTIAQRVRQTLEKQAQPILRPVINATGIVLHTNLGRSPLPIEAAQAVCETSQGYVNLELDLETGKRSSRQNPIRNVLSRLFSTESGTVVNNCAAATVITLRALAMGKEVIVSRGQLIEIGGSFRIPEIMAVSGAILKEVGTTNRTRIADYERAITPQTALLMRIHCSNYRVRGFTQEASLEELIELGRKYNLPVIDDAGSGAMFDFARFGLAGDPVVTESVRRGASLVLFSGDKLLGGPQAGLIVGQKNLIQKIEKDPLMRAFRLDKMTLVALERTLRLYENFPQALEKIPLLQMLAIPLSVLKQRCERLLSEIVMLPNLTGHVQEESAYVGGGSLPDLALPTYVIRIQSQKLTEEELAARLRMGSPAVMPRVQKGQVWLDLRTVFPHQEEAIVQALRKACG